MIPTYRQFFVALSSQNIQDTLNIASGIVGNELQLLIQPDDLSSFFPVSYCKSLSKFIADGFSRGLATTLAPLIIVLKSREFKYGMTHFTESLIKDICLVEMLLTQASQVCYAGSFQELCDCGESLLKASPLESISILAQQSAKWIQCDSKDWKYYFDRDLFTVVQALASSVEIIEFLPDLKSYESEINHKVDPKGYSVAFALLKSYVRQRLMICVFHI